MSGNGPDYFGFFTHELEQLFSGNKDIADDYFPSMELTNGDKIMKKIGEDDLNGNRTSEGCGVKKLETLFSDGLGGELLDYRKEKLNVLLKQSVEALTHEVDLMVEDVLATCQLQHHLRSKETPLSSQVAASGDNCGGSALSKKNKKKGRCCAFCETTSTVQWRYTSDGTRMCNTCGLRLKKGTSQLSPEKKNHNKNKEATSSSSQSSASGHNDGDRPSKKHKQSVSQKGYLARPQQTKSLADILCQIDESCAYCNMPTASLWKSITDGSRMCNACGLRLRKGTSELSPEKKDTNTNSLIEDGNMNEEVNDDIKFILSCDRQQVEQTVKNYTDGISSSLDCMEKQLEGFLYNITSKCRIMTFFEKQRLWKLIKDLPPKNLDRVAEIIKHGEGLEHEKKDLFVDLEDMDNAVLWRLYYYAKAVENAQKLIV